MELKLVSGRLGRVLRISTAAFHLHLSACSLLGYLAVTGPHEIIKISL